MSTIEDIRARWERHDYTVSGRKTLPIEAYNATVVLARADVRDLLAEVDRLRGALLALVALPPLRYHEMRCYCHHCGAQLPNGNSGHEADCAWVRACDLVAGAAVRP